MKKHNPTTPLLVREAFGVSPKIWARYGTNLTFYTKKTCLQIETEMGQEASVGVDGLSASEVEKKLQELAQKQ